MNGTMGGASVGPGAGAVRTIVVSKPGIVLSCQHYSVKPSTRGETHEVYWCPVSIRSVVRRLGHISIIVVVALAATACRSGWG